MREPNPFGSSGVDAHIERGARALQMARGLIRLRSRAHRMRVYAASFVLLVLVNVIAIQLETFFDADHLHVFRGIVIGALGMYCLSCACFPHWIQFIDWQKVEQVAGQGPANQLDED